MSIDTAMKLIEKSEEEKDESLIEDAALLLNTIAMGSTPIASYELIDIIKELTLGSYDITSILSRLHLLKDDYNI